MGCDICGTRYPMEELCESEYSYDHLVCKECEEEMAKGEPEEPESWSKVRNFAKKQKVLRTYKSDGVGRRNEPGKSKDGNNRANKQDQLGPTYKGFNERWKESPVEGANDRNVWKDLKQSNFKGAHFACFPPDLPRKCIKAGSSEKGCCSECGAPYHRNIEYVGGEKTSLEDFEKFKYSDTEVHQGGRATSTLGGKIAKPTITGWAPTCDCRAEIRPSIILDPFGGVGTTGLAANELQRDAILVEINPEYADMAARRIRESGGLLANVEVKGKQDDR